MVRWHGAVFCPDCRQKNVIKHCLCQQHLQRYTRKGCLKTFNDKTCAILHYGHTGIDDWLVALWLLHGPLNDASIRFIFQATGRSYKTPCYMVHGIMERMRGLPKKSLQGTRDTNEEYQGYRSLKERGYGHYTADHRGLVRRR